jgi:hypothetical protein
VSTNLHTVHVRINDAASGQPTPARVRFFAEDGQYYAPLGRLKDFALGFAEDVGGNVLLNGKSFAHVDGSFEIPLPPEPFTLEISKGPEYTPLRREVAVGPGKLSIRLALERWINLREERWYSGDCQVHNATPHSALLEGMAEDVAVVNLLAAQTSLNSSVDYRPHQAIPNVLAFSGQEPAIQKPGYMVAVNTLNRHAALGSLALLNCHRVVYPLVFGHPDGPETWNLGAWCNQCHRKGGLVIWCDPASTFTNQDAGGGEALAQTILGKVDALQVDGIWGLFNDAYPWYSLLNCGFRIPLAGGSGKSSNREALGSVRTYARLKPGEEFTYKNWIEAVRAGRTFVTNGPLLTFTVNDVDPGDAVNLPGPSASVHVHAEARGHTPFEKLELVANGKVIADCSAGGSPARAVLDLDIPIRESGWMAARCSGTEAIYASGQSDPIGAHTSPVYIGIEGGPQRIDHTVVSCLQSSLEKSMNWLATKATFENDKQREQIECFFQAAMDLLKSRQS